MRFLGSVPSTVQNSLTFLLCIYLDGLDMKCPQKVHVLKVVSPDDGVIQRWLDHEGTDFINGLMRC
jgi:hypothetical protein